MVDDSQLALISGQSSPTYTLSHAMSEAVAKEESSAARLVSHACIPPIVLGQLKLHGLVRK